MGCANSKAGADVVVADVYRPPPTSVSLFDISAVEEPWLIAKNKDADGEDDESEEEEETDDEDDEEEMDEKKSAAAKNKAGGAVPLPLLDKLEGYELAPASWSEVSKALEDMKPTLDQQQQQAPPPPPKKKKKKKKKKTTTTVGQQEPARQAAQPTPPQQPKPATDAAGKKPAPLGIMEAAPADKKPPPPELTGRRVVKDNPFLMRDRESSKDGAASRWRRRDPFEGCPERRPPGPVGGGVVLYTTSLRGVRRTFEDCERARELVEACAEAAGLGALDERDVALHGEYLRELRELLAASGDGGGGEGQPAPVAVAPPRLFVMGRYVGGAEECAALAESGKLREMMRWAKARGEACAAKDGRGCEGCGGARFVPCWECGGSCKVVAAADGGGGEVERCGKCNENGLMLCPICH